jgi:protein-S-isoprenylcysteine O-methyltransferase Ste14
MPLDPALHRQIVLGLFGAALVTYVALRFIVAPYGKHARGGWGPTLSDRAAWVLMESPSFFGFAWVFANGVHRAEPAPLALAALWLLHYGQRTLVYPFVKRDSGRRMPLVVALLGFTFNGLNALVNAAQIASIGEYTAAWLVDPRFVIGAAMFLGGLAINVDADRRLRALRKPGEKGYAIPRGGLYELVSCPNYFGEIVEWVGWAVATWSLAGASFAAYTIANLAPRARANDAWYRATFPDYPAKRRRLVPFVL